MESGVGRNDANPDQDHRNCLPEESPRYQSFFRVTAGDIVLPPVASDAFESWKADPAGFLYHQSKPTSLYQFYRYARELSALQSCDQIRRRFVTTDYFDTAHALSRSARYSAKRDTIDLLVEITGVPPNGCEKDVRHDLTAWINEVKRNRKMANKLGSTGCFFFYPNISDWIWKKDLPLRIYKRAAAHLRDNGILSKAEQSGAVELARNTEMLLKSAFQSMIVVGNKQCESVFWNAEVRWNQKGIALSAALSESRTTLVEDRNKARPRESALLSRPFDSSPRLAAQNLTKWQGLWSVPFPDTDDLAPRLFSFYLNLVCPGRTILKQNAYEHEFLPVLQSTGSSMDSVLGLAALYLKEYYLVSSYARIRIEEAELRYSVSNVAAIVRAIKDGNLGAATSVSSALLLHHATMNSSIYTGCWTKYLYPLMDNEGFLLNSNLAMASVAILAMTALPTSRRSGFQNFSYDWIRQCDFEQLTRADSTLGLSREMLHLIYQVTKPACSKETILKEIDLSPFSVEDADCNVARFVALMTAETYRTGAQMYCLARLYGYPPQHEQVTRKCELLQHQLHQLPIEGQWYSSIHPAWSFVIACVCVKEVQLFEDLFAIMARIAGENTSNVDDCCGLVTRAKNWQSHRWGDKIMPLPDDGWWEDISRRIQKLGRMSGMSYATLRFSNLCLSFCVPDPPSRDTSADALQMVNYRASNSWQELVAMIRSAPSNITTLAEGHFFFETSLTSDHFRPDRKVDSVWSFEKVNKE
ncbi:hypothetical protein CERZMDRAFT_97794 [Cercospora zeae-maydis SCOH1-5]|uniref:Transcription factor domain-containing protein n=1 Tax=Cercospora zeae-maydis SCOH1-5 TaxID=717836 RepID=A0A6A6FEK0_9PEZI|nr:hypothetical protein CERZMDRAFT_97794 [Cercospora zeae-maydis SCOH1-5]